MIEKKAYLDKLEKMANISTKYDFLAQTKAQCEQLKDRADDFAFRVILIGGFSSGKSAFLNRLIGRELFKENLGPETALPAEVSWAPVESCQAIFGDGKRMELDLATATARPPEDAHYIAMSLDNQFLKQRPELILVDFPGYDSNVEAHNAAISAYLKKGSAFLLLIPAQNGALTASDIKFLKEAASYPQALGCFISKSDVRPPEKCEEIAKYVASGIAAHYGEEAPVAPISVMPDCAPDFEERVGTMVDRFEPQSLFNLSLAPAINEQLTTAIKALEEYKDACQLDNADLENRMLASQELIEDLGKQLEKERIGLNRKYQYEIIPDIISRLDNAFHANAEALVEAALTSSQRFGDVAQSIARPILASVPGEIHANLRDVVSNMRIENKPGALEENDIRASLLNIVDVISTFVPTSGQPKLPPTSPGPTVPPPMMPHLPGMGTGLLVWLAGSPILGAAIALAPTLINLFFGGKSPKGPDPRQLAKAQVEGEGIPAILQGLENAITPAIMETRDQMFKEIEKKIREKQQAATQAIEQAKAEKESRAQEHASSQEQIQADIDVLIGLLIQA